MLTPDRTATFTAPSRLRKANISAEIYKQLASKDILAYLDYPLYCPHTDSGMVADIAVYNKDEIVCLIVVKSRKKHFYPHVTGERYQKYISTGLPILYCFHMDEVGRVIRDVIDRYAYHTGTIESMYSSYI